MGSKKKNPRKIIHSRALQPWSLSLSTSRQGLTLKRRVLSPVWTLSRPISGIFLLSLLFLLSPLKSISATAQNWTRCVPDKPGGRKQQNECFDAANQSCQTKKDEHQRPPKRFF